MAQSTPITLMACDRDGGAGGVHRSQAGRRPSSLACLHPRCLHATRPTQRHCQCGGFIGSRTPQCRRCGRVLRSSGPYRQLVLDL